MGLYTKTDKQLDNLYEVVSSNKSLSKQFFFFENFSFITFNFYCFSDYEDVSIFLIFIIFVIVKHFI